MKKREAEKERYLYLFLSIAVLTLYYLPHWILGQDAVFRISDFLDDEVIQYELSGKYLFASGDTIVKEWLSGAPLATIQPPCFLLVLFFKFFSFYHAVILSSVFGRVTAYAGMFLLCGELLGKEERHFSFMASTLFCILPFYPSYGLSSVGLPLVAWACLKLYKGNSVTPWIAFVLYALSSSLVWSGYFVVFFVFMAAIVLLFRKKRAAAGRLAAAGAGMTILYIVIFWNTIAGILFGTMNSHRNDPGRVYEPQEFWDNVVSLFKYGQYHAPSLHTYIMAFAFVSVGAGLLCYKKMNKGLRKRVILAAVLWGTALLIALFRGFYNSAGGYAFRERLGGLSSFQVDRIYWVYPALWYTELAISASVLFHAIKIGGERMVRYSSPKNGAIKKMHGAIRVSSILFAAVFTVFFAGYIIRHPNSVEYEETWNRVFGRKEPERGDLISYREFYDCELFQEVEEFIGRDQKNYRVACLGFVPAIAQMNGFYTIDGYCTNYPLEYKYRFRSVIGRELEKSDALRQYYDNWGNRCYLFSAELGIKFQNLKSERLVIKDLQLDTEALRKLGCDYIFSAVRVENAVEIGWRPLGVFSGEHSVIEIYVYDVCGDQG